MLTLCEERDTAQRQEAAEARKKSDKVIISLCSLRLPGLLLSLDGNLGCHSSVWLMTETFKAVA